MPARMHKTNIEKAGVPTSMLASGLFLRTSRQLSNVPARLACCTHPTSPMGGGGVRAEAGRNPQGKQILNAACTWGTKEWSLEGALVEVTFGI